MGNRAIAPLSAKQTRRLWVKKSNESIKMDTKCGHRNKKNAVTGKKPIGPYYLTMIDEKVIMIAETVKVIKI